MNEYISSFLFLFCFRVLATRTPLCLTALSRRGWAGVKFSLFLSPHHRGINILCPLSAALTNDMEKPISIFLSDVLLLTRRPILLDPGHNPTHDKYERNTKTIVNINTQAQYSGTSGSIQRIVLFGTQAIKSNKIGNSTQINPLMSLTSQWLLLNQVPMVHPHPSNIFTQMYLLPHLWHFATVQVPSLQPGSFCSGKNFCWTGNFWELVEISKFSEAFHSVWYVTIVCTLACPKIQIFQNIAWPS